MSCSAPRWLCGAPLLSQAEAAAANVRAALSSSPESVLRRAHAYLGACAPRQSAAALVSGAHGGAESADFCRLPTPVLVVHCNAVAAAPSRDVDEQSKVWQNNSVDKHRPNN